MTNDEVTAEERLARIEILRDYRVFAASMVQHTNCTEEFARAAAVVAATALNQTWDDKPPLDKAKMTAEGIKLWEELKDR